MESSQVDYADYRDANGVKILPVDAHPHQRQLCHPYYVRQQNVPIDEKLFVVRQSLKLPT